MFEIGLSLAVILAVALAVRAWRRRSNADRLGFGSHLLVAVARPSTAGYLCQVAAALARSDRGRVTPLAVVSKDASPADRERAEETVRRCEIMLADEGLNARGRVRVDSTVADGILHGSVEYGASVLLLGWPSPDEADRFGAPVDALVLRSRVPILLARLDGYHWERVVLRVPQEPTDEPLRASLRLATETAERLSQRLGLAVSCVSATTPIPESPSQLVIAPLAPREETTRIALAAATPGSDVIFAVADSSQWARSLTIDPAELTEGVGSHDRASRRMRAPLRPGVAS